MPRPSNAARATGAGRAGLKVALAGAIQQAILTIAELHHAGNRRLQTTYATPGRGTAWARASAAAA
ncbi:hypothetical protein XAP412_360050 [Xanthomonas phaseoli pv. phaseoli]|uniref:Uncharacterized protein n=1 Tax=Xanthomonas campestris pv. phaseoli TaxID=317013 RepID=A0AB38E032_XANCH|nr:hypothetical protein XAP412_360050 [Xanthomonas phaseoli pv. phaseoli]SON88958.1 hypothetical protein XAP7430_400067 [Xanthomonas phaseoli pv. phaseoli]SOO27658.1 hypothetical protein XAP6164_1770008 [Xanthomonas phaseoli pv. phaseoli]